MFDWTHGPEAGYIYLASFRTERLSDRRSDARGKRRSTGTLRGRLIILGIYT